MIGGVKRCHNKVMGLRTIQGLVWLTGVVIWGLMLVYQNGGLLWLVKYKNQDLAESEIITPQAQAEYLREEFKKNVPRQSFKGEKYLQVDKDFFPIMSLLFDKKTNTWVEDPRYGSEPRSWMFESSNYGHEKNRVLYLDPEVIYKSGLIQSANIIKTNNLEFIKSGFIEVSYEKLKAVVSELSNDMFVVIEVPASKQGNVGSYGVSYLKIKEEKQ